MTMRIAPISDEFRRAYLGAQQNLLHYPDDSVQYMAEFVPVYLDRAPTIEQKQAGGCTKCTYFGLWAAQWRGMARAEHGMVWLFEDGIRTINGDLIENTTKVLYHELYEHALQNDHVLDAMEQARARGMWAPWRPCGRCPG